MVAVPEARRGRDALLAALSGELRTVFQPIVDLRASTVVGFEALSRGPAGSELERPDRLFAAARARGLVELLDRTCREQAVAAAQRVGLRAPTALFLNAEPDALSVDHSVGNSSELDPPIVLEVTERALLEHPARLLRDLAQARDHGWLIAVDDVGADSRSLALMPLLRPDVIKLDLSLVQQHPSRELAKIVNAVRAEAERSGAAILAEGIETERHLEVAESLGATLGQGYLLGRPNALPDAGPLAAFRSDRIPAGPTPRTPWALLSQKLGARVSRKPLLIEISKQLEAEAHEIGETAIVAAAFQESRYFTAQTAARYQGLAQRTALVAAFAAGLGPAPAPRVRGVRLDPGDPLRGEWTIAVVAPHFAACLAARDLGDAGPELERRFEYVLTFDRDLGISATQSMLSRVTARAAVTLDHDSRLSQFDFERMHPPDEALAERRFEHVR